MVTPNMVATSRVLSGVSTSRLGVITEGIRYGHPLGWRDECDNEAASAARARGVALGSPAWPDDPGPGTRAQWRGVRP